MKNIVLKICFVFSIALMFTISVKAQEKTQLRVGEFGIRYMPTYSSINFKSYNNNVVKGSVTMSNGFGVMLAANLSRHVGVQTEINYYEIKQKYADLNLNREVNIHYLNIPVLLSLNTNKTGWINWNLVVGPQFGLNIGSSLKTTGDETSTTIKGTLATKNGDVGLAFGTGLEIALNENHTSRLDFGYRGFYGLVNIDASVSEANTYNIIGKASRKTNGAYLGLTFLF